MALVQTKGRPEGSDGDLLAFWKQFLPQMGKSTVAELLAEVNDAFMDGIQDYKLEQKVHQYFKPMGLGSGSRNKSQHQSQPPHFPAPSIKGDLPKNNLGNKIRGNLVSKELIPGGNGSKVRQCVRFGLLYLKDKTVTGCDNGSACKFGHTTPMTLAQLKACLFF